MFMYARIAAVAAAVIISIGLFVLLMFISYFIIRLAVQHGIDRSELAKRIMQKKENAGPNTDSINNKE